MKLKSTEEIVSVEPALITRLTNNYIDPNEPLIIHIAKQRIKSAERFTYLSKMITECNRVITNYDHYRFDYVVKGKYRLCSRCGTEEDFAKVFQYKKERWEKFVQKERSENARKNAEYAFQETCRNIERMILDAAKELRKETIEISVGELLDLLKER